MTIYYDEELRKHYDDCIVSKKKKKKILFFEMTETTAVEGWCCNHCDFQTDIEKNMKEHMIKKHEDILFKKGHYHYTSLKDKERKDWTS